MESLPEETPLIRAMRCRYHRYRDGALRFGHPLLRRLLQATLPKRLRATLGSGIRLELDLSIPLQQTLFWLNGDLEPQLSWAIREFVPEKGTLVDCGANTGYFGLEARAVRKARVLFVEPHPRLAKAIRSNIDLNGCSANCELVEAAASDHAGFAKLYICSDNDGSHSLLPDWTATNRNDNEVEVKLARLDAVLNAQSNFERVDFMKVDTEGHDLKALQGLGDRLTPTIVACLYTELGRDRAQAIQLLKDRGYIGFVARPFRSGVHMRRTARRAESGLPVCFFLPDDGARCEREVLWCAKDSPIEARLRELAREGTISK